MAPPELVIAIPAFNEVETLEAVVRAGLAQLDRMRVDGQVLIVDDGSVDGTGALADDLCRRDPRVTVEHHPKNLGFSGAIRTALTARKADLVFLGPADGQVPMEVLADLWERRGAADVVVGVRRPRADSMWRRVLSWGYHTISRVLLGVPLPEFSSALLLRSTVLAFPLASRADSAALLAELMCRACAAGARFALVPYRHRPRAAGKGKGGDVRVAARTLLDLVRVAWLVRWRHR